MPKKLKLKSKPTQMKLHFATVRFDGAVYNPEHDQKRLTGAMLKVFECMQDQKWRTYDEINYWIESKYGKPINMNSLSSYVRHLRKFRFGEHTVNRRYRGDPKHGLYEWQLIVNHDWIHYRMEKGEI